MLSCIPTDSTVHGLAVTWTERLCTKKPCENLLKNSVEFFLGMNLGQGKNALTIHKFA